MTKFRCTDDLGNYLGMPLIHGRLTRRDFQKLIDKVKSKLAGWKTNCLSMAGRVTLAKSVISSIPFYAMQSTRIPMSICSEIEMLQRNFIWGPDENKRKVHTISWETVCRNKNQGGWELKSLVG